MIESPSTLIVPRVGCHDEAAGGSWRCFSAGSPTNYGNHLSACADLLARMHVARYRQRQQVPSPVPIRADEGASDGTDEARAEAESRVTEKCLLGKIVELLNLKGLSKSALQLGGRLQRRRHRRRRHRRQRHRFSSASTFPPATGCASSATSSLYFEPTLETIVEETELELDEKLS